MDKETTGGQFTRTPQQIYHTPERKPHLCPVCLGKGFVAHGFYISQTGHYVTNSTAPEQCRSCGGQGIIWG